jgi:hypothetical protein
MDNIAAEGKQFGNDLKNDASGLKNLASNISRKEINFNIIEKISRIIYANPNHLIKVEFIQYIMFIVLLYIYNPFDINTKFPVFTKLLVLIVAFVYVVLFFFIRMKVDAAEDVDLIAPTEKTVLYQFISTILCFVLFMLAIKGIIWLFVHTDLLMLFRRMFGLFSFIGILGIGYLVMKKTIDKAKNSHGKSIFKLLLKIILFLPCLMVDMAEYIKYQFHLTTKPVWILCGIEAVIIAAWFLVPILLNKIVNYDSTKLLNEPVNLDEEIVLSNFTNSSNPNDLTISLDEKQSNIINAAAKKDIDQQSQDTLDNARDLSENYIDQNIPKNKYLAWLYTKIKNFTWLKVKFTTMPSYTEYSSSRFLYTYALSGWFYINPQPPSTSIAYNKYTNILNYGKKIIVEYNSKLNSLRVMAAKAGDNVSYSKNKSVEVYKTSDIMHQKWNNIVINYDDGMVDVFLNGTLVASASGIMPYMTFDHITTGETNGIMGGICNVNYYKHILPEKTIRMNYKTLRIKEFPYVETIINTNIKIKKGKKDERFKRDMERLLTGA